MLWPIYVAFVLLAIFMSTIFKKKKRSYKKKVYITLISLALFFLIMIFALIPIASAPFLEPFKLLKLAPVFFILFFNFLAVILLSAFPSIYFFIFKKVALKFLGNNPNNLHSESKIKKFLVLLETVFTVMICFSSFLMFYASTFIFYEQLLRDLHLG